LFDENFHLGLSENEVFDDIQVFPNPSNSKINIVNSNSQPLGKIEITNLMGNIVVIFSENSRKVEVDISNYAPGIYIIKCERDDKAQLLKFIKL